MNPEEIQKRIVELEKQQTQVIAQFNQLAGAILAYKDLLVPKEVTEEKQKKVKGV